VRFSRSSCDPLSGTVPDRNQRRPGTRGGARQLRPRVGGLRQEDFELLADGKPQSSPLHSRGYFGRAAQDRSAQGARNTAAIMPEHFAAIVFDDAHLSNLDDIVYTRRAADKYLATLQPADRAGLFTASGQSDVDFQPIARRFKLPWRSSLPGRRCFLRHDREELARAIIGDCEKMCAACRFVPARGPWFSLPPDFHPGANLGLYAEVMRMVDHAIRSVS